MKLTSQEWEEIKALNHEEQEFWKQQFGANLNDDHKRHFYSKDGLMTAWYFPKLIEYIEALEKEIEQLKADIESGKNVYG